MDVETTASEAVEPVQPTEPAPLVANRFLFVDIAALRAKQLRRGARPRIEQLPDGSQNQPHKPERVAMEEVRRRLVYYDLPPTKAAGGQASP